MSEAPPTILPVRSNLQPRKVHGAGTRKGQLRVLSLRAHPGNVEFRVGTHLSHARGAGDASERPGLKCHEARADVVGFPPSRRPASRRRRCGPILLDAIVQAGGKLLGAAASDLDGLAVRYSGLRVSVVRAVPR
jgi:hypothetical protein